MSTKKQRLDYVNHIAPEHDRTSCSDKSLYNAAYNQDDFNGHGRCYRCTLLMAAVIGKTEDSHSEVEL